MKNERSLERREFARLCILEMGRAAKLAGGKSPDPDTLQMLAEDMADSPALARVPSSRVRELFAHARAHHSETPVLRHLVKSWATISPKTEPTPRDAPRLPAPPELCNSDAQMRKLAAARTVLAERGQMGLVWQSGEKTAVAELYPPTHNLADQLEPEEWMIPLLEQDPSRVEVEAMLKASTPSSFAFYKRRPDIYPCWGKWLAHYGF